MALSKRKRKFVDASVQSALVRRVMIHWFVFLAALLIVASCMQFFSDPFQPFSKHISELWWNHGFVLVVLVALLPVFIFDSIKLSNRFAGPVHRFRQTVRDLANGKPFVPVSFRGADYWRTLAEDFNTMVARLSGKSDEQPES